MARALALRAFSRFLSLSGFLFSFGNFHLDRTADVDGSSGARDSVVSSMATDDAGFYIGARGIDRSAHGYGGAGSSNK